MFWELTSITSFLLIGYWHHNQAARDGARMSLTVTGVGGLALLGGVLIIGHIVGSYDPVSYTHLDVYKRQEQKLAQLDFASGVSHVLSHVDRSLHPPA